MAGTEHLGIYLIKAYTHAKHTMCPVYLHIKLLNKVSKSILSKLHPFYAEINKNLTATDHMIITDQDLSKN